VFRRLVRLPLQLVPAGTVVPILTGPARGSLWIVGTLTHGCWLGTYERRTQAQLVYGLRPGDVAYDVGANAGFFTLLMSKLVGPAGRVHAFEPHPRNLENLHRHLALNNVANVTVHPVAVGDKTGKATFHCSDDSATGRLARGGELTVDCVALDDLDIPPPNTVKMDIEGGEGLALCGMTRILRTARPFLVVEGHAR
jgi:FkbM family methyltransferase